MKKKFTKLMTMFITVLIMTVLLPVAAQAAVKVLSGDGSESNPYEMTISGACKEESFRYNVYPDSEDNYGYASSMKLKSAKTVLITVKDAENYFNFRRTESDWWIRESDFIVRSGETVHLKVRARGSGINTMKITAKVVSSEEYCPNNANGRHIFYSNEECSRRCGYKCKHPRESREYSDSFYENITVNGVSKHIPEFKCNACDGKWHSDPADAKTCTPEKWSKESAEVQNHHGICTVCQREAYMPCKYKTVYKKADWSQHYVDKKCKVCGGYDGSYYKKQKHSFKNNVCTKCKFKRVVPGALKINSLKGTVKKETVTIYGHWSGNYWIPAKQAIRYTYEISCNMSSKNAVKYILSSTKTGEYVEGVPAFSSKKRYKVKFVSYKPISKITVYASAVSKTGTPTKIVKRTVRFS